MSERVIKTSLNEALIGRYVEYSKSVITERALPNASDGLKPVNKRIIYDMHELGVHSNSKPKKAARLVGDVLGKYHPHGDASTYLAMVYMSQSWNTRYPLVSMDCNNGSIDGDPPAAMRYTEAKLSKIGDLLLQDINKDTVDFIDNYDGTEKEPVCLPGPFPGLLANGTEGIAVGMSTYIPPHNLTEIYDACIFILNKTLEQMIFERENGIELDEENYSLKDIMQIIKGPDFPWGGVICSTSGLKQAFETGKGRITLRCKYEITEDKYNNRNFKCIRISEIPYKENKAKIVEKIENLSNSGAIEGIYEVVDETDKTNVNGVNIAIYLKKQSNPEIIINKLFRTTGLQKNINYNMMALVDKKPVQLSLMDALQEFISNSFSVLMRKTIYNNSNVISRLEILEAILAAKEDVEATIQAVVYSETPKEDLIKYLELTERQADYIYNMKIKELNRINIDKIKEEDRALKIKSEEYNRILNDEEYALEKLKSEFVELKEKYGDERRTEIVLDEITVSDEDLMLDEQLVITISSDDNIRSVSEKEYASQHKGGRGTKLTNNKEDETIVKMFTVNNKDTIIFFTNKGRGHFLKAYKINKGSKNSKGKNIANYITLDDDERIVDTVAIRKDDDQEYIIFATKTGLVKKLHKNKLPKRGVPARLITLLEDDEVIGIETVSKEDDILVSTEKGLGLRYDISGMRDTGRTSRGNKCIKLNEGDHVASLVKAGNGGSFIVLTDNGIVKKTNESNISARKNRGGKGVKIQSLSEDSKIVEVLYATDDDHIMVFTSDNRIIRIELGKVPSFGRTAVGSKVMTLDEGEHIIGASVIPFTEEEEN